jgi:hypothetical protein
MAMEVVKVIDTGREVPTSCMAYNTLKREVFTATEGERVVKVGKIMLQLPVVHGLALQWQRQL